MAPRVCMNEISVILNRICHGKVFKEFVLKKSLNLISPKQNTLYSQHSGDLSTRETWNLCTNEEEMLTATIGE